MIRLALESSVQSEGLFAFLKEKGIVPVFSVLLTDNAGIRALNARFRGIDSETDVLSFPAVDTAGGILQEIPDGYAEVFPDGHREVQMGDIVLSLERAEAQAAAIGNTFSREVAFLTVHSFLHLIGYDHGTEMDETAMRSRQRAIMNEWDKKVAVKGDSNATK